MVLRVREITEKEKEQLGKWTMSKDEGLKLRAWVILLSNDGLSVPKIGEGFHRHPVNLRKWIHRFNKQGCEGIKTVRRGGRKVVITEEQKKQIADLSRKSPRSFGLNYGWWSLHRLTEEVCRQGIVSKISHEKVRQILWEAGIYSLRGI